MASNDPAAGEMLPAKRLRVAIEQGLPAATQTSRNAHVKVPVMANKSRLAEWPNARSGTPYFAGR